MYSTVRNRISHYLDVFYNKYYPPQILFRNRQRKRLINKHFSLLTGNCIGGYIYHQLGLQFLSPTINMMIYNQDFKKLILNLKAYLDIIPQPGFDLRFPDIPTATLGDILLHFTHYSTIEEGIKAWENRKRRIDFDNLYIIISDIDLSRQDIEDLQNVPCKKIVVMTANDWGYKHCLYIPEYHGQERVGELLGKTISGKWRFEQFFDFVEWVNSEDKVAQHFYIGGK